jgi:hypothetical protein
LWLRSPCNSALLEAAALTLQLCSALVTFVDRYMCVLIVFEAAISLLLTDLIETSILEPILEPRPPFKLPKFSVYVRV